MLCLYVKSLIKTVKPIRTKSFDGPHMTPGKNFRKPELKKLSLGNFIFSKSKRKNDKSANFFVIVWQLKGRIEDWREDSWKPSVIYVAFVSSKK